jgi:hypothetical protein
VRRTSGGGVVGIVAAFVILLIGVGGGLGFYFYKSVTNKTPATTDTAGKGDDDSDDNDGDGVADTSKDDAGKPDAKGSGADGEKEISIFTKDNPLAPSPIPGMRVPTTDNMVRKIVDNPAVNAGLRTAYGRVPANRVTDIMIVYSRARRGAGGPLGMFNFANGVVQHANDTFRNAGVNGMLRLVAVVEVDYDDNDKTKDLNLVAKLRSGLDGVEGLRSRVGADLVCLLGTRGGGGVAHSPGTYSVVKRGRWPSSFTHEIQHNFGWKHGHGPNLFAVKNYFPLNAGKKPEKIALGKVYIQYRDKPGPGRM